MDSNRFVLANVYSTGSSADGYSFVTGTGTGATVDGYTLMRLEVSNASGSALFALIFDGYAAPTAGAHPIAQLQVAANGQGVMDLSSVQGLSFKNGITVAASTASWSFTYAGTQMRTTAYFI